MDINRMAYDVSLARFFNIMCSKDDRLFSGVCNINQMIPNALSNDWIDANGWLVQNQEFGL